MSLIYHTQGFAIYPHRQVIVLGDETIQVRPKTFALLLLLLEKPREVLSKKFLLDSIWDDVSVEEQVLVQSIGELRKLLRNPEIIQTYPRKGYAWAADVATQTELAAGNVPVPATATPVVIAAKASHRKITLGLLSVALLITLAALMFHRNSTATQIPTEVVMVLPVKNQMQGNDHNWVALGGMDQLINLLAPDKNVQVMTTEYILQVMQYAHVPRVYDSEQVGQIFSVSGATLIVESQLSGTVENYRLDYKLRAKNSIKRGVIFDKDLNQAIHQLAEVVVSQTGQKLYSDSNAQTAFGNELMVQAMEKLDQMQLEPAVSLFTSMIQLQPENLTARKKLIETLIKLKKFDQAKVEIDAALAQINADNSQEATKIYFLLAVLHLEQDSLDAALATFEKSDQLAQLSNNILYRSHIAFIRGDIYQKRGDLALAQTAYEQSMQLDNSIRCPIGVSISHIKLAKLWSLQGNPKRATEHYNAAKKLIDSNQLDDMQAELASAKP